MRISGEFDYRNSRAALDASSPGIYREILRILEHPDNNLDLSSKGKQRNLSKQVQLWFVQNGWKSESPPLTLPDLRYDLIKDRIPLEIEIGHKRLVYADFFKFLADYSKSQIPAAVMVVTGDPLKFGHSWHNNLESTSKKIAAVSEVFLVPILVVAIDP